MAEEEVDMPRGQYDRHPPVSAAGCADQEQETPPATVPDPRDAEIASLHEEVRGLTSLVMRVLAAQDKPAMESQAEFEAKAPPLPSAEDERARILAAWAAEPKVNIVISPDANDENGKAALQAQAKRAGQDPDTVTYPPRVWQVNGVQLAVPVGVMYSVPYSLAQMYEYMLNPWKALKRQPPITFSQAQERIGLSA